jgi:uncharacterized protein (DUF433 family)
MPRTSTAERHHYICPFCGRPLARDLDHQGWVRHKERPDVAELLSDPAKRQTMSEEDVRFLVVDQLCPFERGEKDDVSPPAPRYQFLEPRLGSRYRQWFVKGRKIRAEILYRQTLDPDSRTPEELAADYDLPTEAVLEAIEYCLHNEEVLRQDFEEEEAATRRIEEITRLATSHGCQS